MRISLSAESDEGAALDPQAFFTRKSLTKKPVYYPVLKVCIEIYILFYLSSRLNTNAPKHFEMLWGKTSNWVSVLCALFCGQMMLSPPVRYNDLPRHRLW